MVLLPVLSLILSAGAADGGWDAPVEPWMIEIVLPPGRPLAGAPGGVVSPADASAEDAAWLPGHLGAALEASRREEERVAASRAHAELSRKGLYFDVDGSLKPLPDCLRAKLAARTPAGAANGPTVRPVYDPDYNDVVGFVWSGSAAPVLTLDCQAVGVHEPAGAEASLVQPLDFLDLARMVHALAKMAVAKAADAAHRAAFRRQAQQWAQFVFNLRRLPEVTQTTLRLSAWTIRRQSGLVFDAGRWVFVGYGRRMPLPKGWTPRRAVSPSQGEYGLVFAPPGAANEEIRLMIDKAGAANPRPYGYFRMRGRSGQYLTREGLPSKDNALTHFSLADAGPIPGWPGGGLP